MLLLPVCMLEAKRTQSVVKGTKAVGKQAGASDGSGRRGWWGSSPGSLCQSETRGRFSLTPKPPALC